MGTLIVRSSPGGQSYRPALVLPNLAEIQTIPTVCVISTQHGMLRMMLIGPSSTLGTRFSSIFKILHYGVAKPALLWFWVKFAFTYKMLHNFHRTAAFSVGIWSHTRFGCSYYFSRLSLRMPEKVIYIILEVREGNQRR